MEYDQKVAFQGGLYLFSHGGLAIIECLDNHNTLTRDIILSTVSHDAKGQVIHVGGNSQESLGGVSGLISETSNDSNILALSEGLGFLSIGQGLGRGASLLLHPTDDGVSSPAAAILHGLAILEELQSGVASHLKLLSQLGLLSGVHLTQLDGRVLLSQDSSSLGILGGKSYNQNSSVGYLSSNDEMLLIPSRLHY